MSKAYKLALKNPQLIRTMDLILHVGNKYEKHAHVLQQTLVHAHLNL